MNLSLAWNPSEIAVLDKVATHPVTQRLLRCFPHANVIPVSTQRGNPFTASSLDEAAATKHRLFIGETASFVRELDGNLGEGLLCFPYRKLVPFSNGCPFRCAYCYLMLNYRNRQPYIKINVNWNRMLEELERDLFVENKPTGYNMGEMMDSLALADATGILRELVPYFAQSHMGRLMLLSKSDCVDSLLGLEHANHTVVSWSLNPQPVIERYEAGAASLEARLKAAHRVASEGYPIRFRIDPGILIPDWRKHYADLVDVIFNHGLQPENITLGMLRLLPGHYAVTRKAYGIDLHDAGVLEGVHGDGKLRYPAAERVAFYQHIIDCVRTRSPQTPVSLCRETREVMNALRPHLSPRCNCCP